MPVTALLRYRGQDLVKPFLCCGNLSSLQTNREDNDQIRPGVLCAETSVRLADKSLLRDYPAAISIAAMSVIRPLCLVLEWLYPELPTGIVGNNAG